MIFKYFVEFGEDGGIKKLHKSKNSCKDCQEYIVKLILIDRGNNNQKNIMDSFNKMDTGFNKLLSDLKVVGKNLKNLSGK